jgi:hypothetical protein
MYMAKRIEADITDDLRESVRQYAEFHGVRMPRAYAELIKKGVDCSDE